MTENPISVSAGCHESDMIRPSQKSGTSWLKPGLLPAVLACLSLSACLGDSPRLEEQVQEHDRQLQEMEAMRQEIRSLRGQIDELQSAGGAKGIAESLSKHDAALRQVENSMAMNLNLGDANAQAAHAAQGQNPPRSSLAPQPGQASYGLGGVRAGSDGYAAAVPEGTEPYQPAQGTALAPQLPQANAQTAQHVPAQAPSASTWGQQSPQDEQAMQPKQETPKDIAQALYDSGLNAYNARKYDEAGRSFADFAKNYPKHELVVDAQFYQAECFFQKNEFPEAALAYDTIIKKYPKSAKAPGAYLKQAICFSKLNQTQAAKARMQELIKKFPSSAEATRAKNFLKTNK